MPRKPSDVILTCMKNSNNEEKKLVCLGHATSDFAIACRRMTGAASSPGPRMSPSLFFLSFQEMEQKQLKEVHFLLERIRAD